MNAEKRFKRRRSIIRIFVSCIPDCIWKYMLPVPRMYINPALIKKESEHCHCSHLDDFNNSFNYFRSYIDPKHKMSDQIFHSTPKQIARNQEAKISALQKELQELREQVAKIMEHHCEPLQSSDYASLSNPSSENKFQPSGPPPPPPPLPPSLLSSQIPVFTPVQKSVTPTKIHSFKKPMGFPFGNELLTGLKKVKLKKIEKSPGGGPLKKNERKQNDAGFLEDILRKRFNVIQNLTPESSSHESSLVDDLMSGSVFSN